MSKENMPVDYLTTFLDQYDEERNELDLEEQLSKVNEEPSND